MSADIISDEQVHLIEKYLNPQSEHEFENLLEAFSALLALNFRLLKNPLLLLKKLVSLVNDQLDSGYAQTLNSLILKLKEILHYQVYCDTILQDMTFAYQDKYYSYQDLLLRDLSITCKERDFTKYIQTYGASHRTFVETCLSQYINGLRKYVAFEAANVFEQVLLITRLI